MRSGIYAGRLFGIPLYFAPSWFIVAGFITWEFQPLVASRAPGLGALAYAVAAAFAVLLYASVLVHELAHSVVAKGLGLPVRRIVLQLLGGVSEITREPATADREYLVAIAGPLMSVLLAGVGAALLPLTAPGTVAQVIVGEFAFANAVVAVFNLLPGLPLDGGRVLRAALWHLSGDKVRGTRSAANFGRGLAVLVFAAPLAVGQLTGNTTTTGDTVYLWFLAVFIWTGATQSLVQTRVTAAVPTLRVRDLMRRAEVVTGDTPLAEAIRRARLAGARALVTVDSAGRPEGVVSEPAVHAIPAERRPWVPVSTAARTLTAGLMLDVGLEGQALVEAVQRAPAGEYLVTSADGAVAGVLTQADLAAALRLGTTR